jgi:transposase
MGVHIKRVIKKWLNVNQIAIENIRFEKHEKMENETFIVTVRPTKGVQKLCGICLKRSPGYDKGTKGRLWRTLDLGTIKTYIESNLIRVNCKKHGVVTAHVPWARHGSWFTKDFENTIAWLTLHATRTMVSKFMRISWQSVGAVMKRVYDDTTKGVDLLDGLVNIGIDETSYKKGHKYMMVIVNHDTGALVWVSKSYGKKELDEFFQTLGDERCKNIRIVTADGAKWISSSVAKHCPNAESCLDTFHIVKWATDILDEIRRKLWNDTKKQVEYKGHVNKKPGRLKIGEKRPKDAVKEIKGAKYTLLKNPENLTKAQEIRIEMIAKSNPILYRAYLLKEKLRLLFKLPIEDAKEELDAWIKWAQHCRIPQFVALQRKIRQYKEAILATIENKVSNARIEAINNKIKVTTRMAYGFRNLDNMIALVMLRCSKLDVALPGRLI